MSGQVILAGVDEKNFFRLRARLIEKIIRKSPCIIFCGSRGEENFSSSPSLVVLDNGIEGGKIRPIRLLLSWLKFLFLRKKKMRKCNSAMVFGLFPSAVMIFYFVFLQPKKSVCVLTGLGKLFGRGFLSAPLIRNIVIFYLISFYQAIIVQNRSDYEYIKKKLERLSVKRDLKLILGSGFDQVRSADKLKTRFLESKSNAEVNFLYVGRFVLSKGITDFIDAAIRIVEREPSSQAIYRFTIVGFSYERSDGVSLAQIYKRIEGHEDFFMIVDGSDGALDYLGRADFLVSPSRREGLSLSVIEAMALGVPVIGYDVPGIQDLILHGETGWLVPSGDVASLAEHICLAAKFCKGGNTREDLGRRSREHFGVLGLGSVEIDRQYLEMLDL